MTWLAPKLDRRIQIQKPIQSAAAYGALETTYTTLKTIWAEVKPVSDNSRRFAVSIRGQNATDEIETHIFTVRMAALKGLGTEQGKAFSSAFDTIDDINQIKSNYFIFLNTGSSVKGRRFRIKGARLDESRDEYVSIFASELSEEGTGWPK